MPRDVTTLSAAPAGRGAIPAPTIDAVSNAAEMRVRVDMAASVGSARSTHRHRLDSARLPDGNFCNRGIPEFKFLTPVRKVRYQRKIHLRLCVPGDVPYT